MRRRDRKTVLSRPDARADGDRQRCLTRLELDASGELSRLHRQEGQPVLDLVTRRPFSRQLSRLSPTFERRVTASARSHRSMDDTWWLRGRNGHALLVKVILAPQPDGTSLLTLDAQVPGQATDAEAEAAYADQERAGLLDQIVESVASNATFKESLTNELPLLVEFLSMDAGAVYLVRGGKAEVLAAYGRTSRRGFPYPAVDAGALRTLADASGRPVEFQPDDLMPFGVEEVLCTGASQLLMIAATAGGDARAFVVLSRRTPREFPSQDIRALTTVGRVLGVAAHTEQLSTQSEHSSAILETAYAVSRTISRSLDLEMTFKAIAANVARVVRGSRCLLLEMDPDSGDFVTVAASEADDTDLLGRHLRLQDSDPLLQTATELAVEDLVWGAGVGPPLRTLLTAWSAVFVPMHAHNELIGALLIYTPEEKHRYSRGEVSLAQEVSEQAAIAIHNARLYRDLVGSQRHIETLLARLAQIREKERQRLASIVHDDILQSVVGTVYELEAFRSEVPEESVGRLEEMVAVLRTAIDDARQVISDLRPPALSELGFAASMRALIDRAGRDGTAQVQLHMDEFPSIGQGTAVALYKIAREALANARRHSRARSIRVAVTRCQRTGASCIRLVVEDDGIGADTTQPRPDHFGWTMIQEAAAVVGGWVRIESSPGSGVMIEATVPLGE